jgi:hypothetical protein
LSGVFILSSRSTFSIPGVYRADILRAALWLPGRCRMCHGVLCPAAGPCLLSALSGVTGCGFPFQPAPVVASAARRLDTTTGLDARSFMAAPSSGVATVGAGRRADHSPTTGTALGIRTSVNPPAVGCTSPRCTVRGRCARTDTSALVAAAVQRRTVGRAVAYFLAVAAIGASGVRRSRAARWCGTSPS